MAQTILLADDSKTVRQAAVLAFSGQPEFRLVLAHSADDLMAKLESVRPDVVLLDDSLSHQHGPTLVQKIGESPTRPKVVFLGQRYPEHPSVKKPFDTGALLGILQGVPVALPQNPPSHHLPRENLVSPELIEQIARQKIEEVVWEVVPELAEKMIREELRRLLAAR